MTPLLESLLSELRGEATTTKRVIERVPFDKLDWRPHERSMTLGQLALHVATIPGNLAKLAQLDEFDASQANFDPPVPQDLKQIHDALEHSVNSAESCLAAMSDESALGIWRLTMRGRELMAKPRVAILRSIMLNHRYHHRGQLSVYLRLLEVLVPVIYGRSADENPFV